MCIRDRLHSGSYAPQIILNQAIPNERLEVAQKLWYLHQDCNGEYFLDEELFRSGFPDSTERIAELLEDRAFVSDKMCIRDRKYLGYPYVWGGSSPVSYTHLDVYKRQAGG